MVTFAEPAYMSADEVLANEVVIEAIARGIVQLGAGARVTYNLNNKKSYDWADPEEWVRCVTISFLVVSRDYPAARMRTEVTVPRRTPADSADIVVYQDDACRTPYLVVETKRAGITGAERAQAIEQTFGNANSLRAPIALLDAGTDSALFDVANFPAMERVQNLRGDRLAVPAAYGAAPQWAHIAGQPGDIRPVPTRVLRTKIQYAHSLIWAGGKRDPLDAFDEWSKLLFAKVMDERTTDAGNPRQFQVGTSETVTAVANRVHRLFAEACRRDPTIFPGGIRIELPDKKVNDVVKVLQEVSFIRTDVDSIGVAFEDFFGSVFRGELGQYFTMRQIARFTVAMVEITEHDYVIDPTAGSGGFLLEALLQVWHSIEQRGAGLPQAEIDRRRIDFALLKVFGIEIHPILARICKINLLLHHDGHTNVEGDERSCLDSTFALPRLNPPRDKFSRLVGNPPFGDDVEEGDEDKLGANRLEAFEVAAGRGSVASEHVILERSIQLLEPNGRLGLVVPDGLLNNQGELSNCPRVRRFLAKHGIIEAIISLPDYAFRRSGAQNKTSILFFRKFTAQERVRFEQAFRRGEGAGFGEDEAILEGLRTLQYKVFLAEANLVGFTPTGAPSEQNDLYRGSAGGLLSADQSNTILGEYRAFEADRDNYAGRERPDCMAIEADALWSAHSSHRLDPKYFLFKREEQTTTPAGWVRMKIGDVMRRRDQVASPETEPDTSVVVMTIAQTGEIRPRAAGKGNNPPEWLGMYFGDSSSSWFAARAGDVVFSSIDLWKGCISVVPEDFDNALVTKEFPIYRVTDDRLDPGFLWCLLRSRYYQRAFRAITTGHSNRRRTQVGDFEELEIVFPVDPAEQRRLIAGILEARQGQRQAADRLRAALMAFSDLIDGRVGEQIPDVDAAEDEAAEPA